MFSWLANLLTTSLIKQFEIGDHKSHSRRSAQVCSGVGDCSMSTFGSGSIPAWAGPGSFTRTNPQRPAGLFVDLDQRAAQSDFAGRDRKRSRQVRNEPVHDRFDWRDRESNLPGRTFQRRTRMRCRREKFVRRRSGHGCGCRSRLKLFRPEIDRARFSRSLFRREHRQ